MPKPILCVDFDGVIHSYISGWKGADVVSDPHVLGALDFLLRATDVFRVAIFSSRSNQPGGIAAMQKWLLGEFNRNSIGRNMHEQQEMRDRLPRIEWPTEKPPALVTIDDRAITFTGVWPDLQELLNFRPWNKK